MFDMNESNGFFDLRIKNVPTQTTTIKVTK